MSLSCEKELYEQYSAGNMGLMDVFVRLMDTETLKKLMYHMAEELINRQKEFDNEAHGSEQAQSKSSAPQE